MATVNYRTFIERYGGILPVRQKAYLIHVRVSDLLEDAIHHHVDFQLLR